MRPTFGREYIKNEFQQIGDGLSEPLTVYLIGGGAMSLRDVKGATKDIDLVVPDGDAYGQLWAVQMDPHDWFRINYTDPNTGFHAGWHQDEDHPDLGQTHFQYSTADMENRWGVTFEHETPSLILWEIVEKLLENIRPTYQNANGES